MTVHQPVHEPVHKPEVSPHLPAATGEPSRAMRALNWSSFGFALLQNMCAAILTINSVRLAIGLGSVAAAGGIWPTVLGFHADAIRTPMMIIALIGAVINLLALWQIRRLRNRPAAQWRRVPLSAAQKRSETFQLALSLLTLAMLAVESTLHSILHHHL